MSTLSRTWQSLRTLWHGEVDEAAVAATLAKVRTEQPSPVVWLFGKTQSGKSSIVRFLTGADSATVGSGFRPCTAATYRYPFPDADAAVLEFLDTRGLDDPKYDPSADIAAFHAAAHAMIVTVKITDFAQKTVIDALTTIRQDNPGRHVILALTCLHEALNGVPHGDPRGTLVLDRLAVEQRRTFEGLFDSTLLIDLTKPEEGFAEPNYNGAALKAELLHQLPQAYRHSLEQNLAAVQSLRDLHQGAAGPVIAGYAGLAASAAAVPVPFVDLVLLPALQARMVYALANVYNQELSTSRFVELAGSVGVGLLTRQAAKELFKLIPVVGSAVAAATAFASTYALGKAFCLYFEQVHDGHLPEPGVLKTLYAEQFAAAKKRWAS